MPQLKVAAGAGCPECRQTGMKGRTGVFEVLPVTERIRKLITAKAHAPEITKVARQDGMMTLRESAIRRLAEGVTPFEEVLRVTAELP